MNIIKLHFKSIILHTLFISFGVIAILCSSYDFPDRLFIDNYDLEIFYIRSQWVLLQENPYSEGFFEYPQLAVYLMGIPLLFTSEIDSYVIIFKIILICFTYFNIRLLFMMIVRLKVPNQLILLIFIPSILYFSMCRIETFVIFFLLLSLNYLEKRKFGISAIFLSMSIFVKWYTILFIPVYLNYISIPKHNNSLKISMREKLTLLKDPSIAFIFISIMIILPSLIPQKIFLLLNAYIFHLSRGSEWESIGSILKFFFGWEPNFSILLFGISIEHAIQTFLQLSIIIFIFFVKIKDFNDVIIAGSFGISWFLILSKFQSPQWILWVIPVVFLGYNKLKKINWLIIFYAIWGLCSYIIFIWQFHSEAWWYLVLIIRYIVQFGSLVVLFQNISFTFRSSNNKIEVCHTQ